jgi:hypothetical protein
MAIKARNGEEDMSSTIEFVNGKAYLDYCYLCHESKAVIKHSQSIKHPLICGIMSDSTESGSGEILQEYDHHVFVVTKEKMKVDEENERRGYEDMAKMYDVDTNTDDFKGFV